jgi:hypothetical protein
MEFIPCQQARVDTIFGHDRAPLLVWRLSTKLSTKWKHTPPFYRVRVCACMRARAYAHVYIYNSLKIVCFC